jgi:Fungal specific transcription factor domain
MQQPALNIALTFLTLCKVPQWRLNTSPIREELSTDNSQVRSPRKILNTVQIFYHIVTVFHVSDSPLGAPLNITQSPNSDESFIPYQSPLDLNEAAREYQFDPFDSDDDLELSPQEAFNKVYSESKWSLFQKVNNEDLPDTDLRDYTSFIKEDGMLRSYDAEQVATPLKNAHTARVFMHFISVTSISISIFERQTRDMSSMFSDNGPPVSEGLWTSKLPLMALNHQGLLHAMLGLSSLHIAKLQNGPTSPAMKHYMYSIKRIHNSVGKRDKRHLTTTLAATLLLAFYEVMTAEHSKWCWHLRGASYLIQETDYRRMTFQHKLELAELQAQDDLLNFENIHGGRRGSTDPAVLNDGLINILVGHEVPWTVPLHTSSSDEPFDLTKYHTYQDLFWWYARQDTYQSIISGNRLLYVTLLHIVDENVL